MEVRFKLLKASVRGLPAPGSRSRVGRNKEILHLTIRLRRSPAVTTLTSRLSRVSPHCCSFIVKYGPASASHHRRSAARRPRVHWLGSRIATCIQTHTPGCEMYACVCEYVCTMHIYLMHLLNLARGRHVGSQLAFMGVLRTRFEPNFPHSADSRSLTASSSSFSSSYLRENCR